MAGPLPAYKGDEPYVFVCYSHEDSAVVYPEMAWLQQQGTNLWYDEGISGGKVWRAEIGDAIDAASMVVFYVSRSSLDSSHCNREINLALDEDKSILPVYLEDVGLSSDLRVGLSRVQALHRYRDDGYQKHLLNALGSTEPFVKPPELQRTGKRTLIVAAAIVMALAIAIGWWAFERPQVQDGEPTIAVLPLENLSGDPEQEYIADGMTVALINELGQLGSLDVISRQSVMRFKNSSKSLPEIASELGVDVVLVGTVIREDLKVRVTVQLVDAQTDTNMWSDRFERELSGVLALHADVARAVARQIRLELTPREETLLAVARAVDPEAYDAYQKAQYHQNSYERGGATDEPLRKSIEYLNEAIRRDPDWALAHAALARTYHFYASGGWTRRVGYGGEEEAELWSKSKAASLKALDLDDELAEAYASLGSVLAYDRDWEDAERAYRRGIELNPNLDGVWGFAILFWSVGRWEEAIVRFKRAEEVLPDSLDVKTQLGMVYTCADQHGEAVEQLRKVSELDPEYVDAHVALGYAYMGQSMYEEAVAEMERATALCPETTCGERHTLIPPRLALGEAYARAGRTAEAQEIVRELEEDEEVFPRLYAALGRKDKALDQLEAAVEKRTSLTHGFPLRCSLWDGLRDDPRFQDLVRRINLPQ